MHTNSLPRRFGYAALGLSALAAAGCGGAPSRPNVIIIYGDDVGYGDLSCNGDFSTVATPNVERLAAEGVRFTAAHTTSSTSTPARFGLLTGIYPWRVPGTGVAPGDAAMIIKPDYYTLPDMMREAGYTTAAVGKWHLGLGDKRGEQDWNGRITPGLEDIGFDYSFIMAATGDRVPCVYIEDGRVVGLDPADPIEVSYSKPFEGEPTGRDNPELLTKLRPSHGHDMAIVNGVSRIGWMRGGRSALWVDEEICDRITEKAVDFIRRSAESDKPFFLYFGTNDIHVPRVPNERFAGRSGMGPRGDAILSFDWQVGEIMRALDSLGIADNTLVILSSDNGPVIDDGYEDGAVEMLGDHRPWGEQRGGKYSAFEAGTRTPFVVRWPDGGVRAGRVSDALMSHIDLFASLAELVGVEIPEGAARDSRPALRRLLGRDRSDREWVVEQSTMGAVGIVRDGWKYIAPTRGPRYDRNVDIELGNDTIPQLYDLRNDPGERHNVAAEHPDMVRQMKACLDSVKVQ